MTSNDNRSDAGPKPSGWASMRFSALLGLGLCIGGGVASGAALARSRLLHWGATGEELCELLPGDSLLPDPHLESTRAITIQRSPEAVWPWIAQLGQGRGGLYTYDRLENLIGCDIHSVDRVIPEWQEVQAGDAFNLHPEVALRVAVVDAPRALVVRGGIPMGSVPSPFDFSWAFVLHDGPMGGTRLVVRERYRYLRAWAGLIVEPTAVVSFLMTQKMLRSIRDRAEATDASTIPSVVHNLRHTNL